MSILFPIVPLVPGVPPISKRLGQVIAVATLLVQDAVLARAVAPIQWGIFLGGDLALKVDSFLDIDYRKDWDISDYPLENGRFESYNKVREPYDVQLQLAKGGSDAEREAFLATLETIADSLDLYDVVTPEYTYVNANVTRIGYRRGARNGVSLLVASVRLQEVRSTATASFANVAQPPGAQQRNGGVVQAIPAPVAVEAPTGEGGW